MKKILIIGMVILCSISFSKRKPISISAPIDTRKEITSSTTENVISNKDKYFSNLNYLGKDYKVLFVEDYDVFRNLRKKLKEYKNLAVYYIPQKQRNICMENENISEVFFFKNSQVDITNKNGNICTKKQIDKILSFSENLDIKEIGKIDLDYKGKVFINRANINKVFN